VLLAVQLLGLLLYPWMESSARGRALFGAFGLLVLGAALWVVRRSPWLTWLGLLLALPVTVLSVVEAVFYFYATGSLIAYMLQDWVATTDELFAAGATFTLLAWAFAYVYVVCQALLPGSFALAGDATAQRTWMELLFLSVAVLSSRVERYPARHANGAVDRHPRIVCGRHVHRARGVTTDQHVDRRAAESLT
jgi:hypothetical protein